MTCCGVCGTDGHIHDGEFIAKFPLIPGHEAIGKVVEMGKNVKGFEMGDRCVADVGMSVGFSVLELFDIMSHYFRLVRHMFLLPSWLRAPLRGLQCCRCHYGWRLR